MNATEPTKAFIDIEKIRDTPENYAKAMWLKCNGDYIDYDASAQSIIDVHNLISPPPAGYQLGVAYSEMTLAQLKGKITALGCDYTNDRYNNFVELSFDANHDIVLKHTRTFDPNNNSYAIALLKSIAKKSANGEACKIKFYDAKKGTKSIIVLGTDDSQTVRTYDFSDHPFM
ncbi:hypothetical protein [Flavobacterium sp. 3HN19-14]|uniref:hypothetical protein n=1 Tax=Flavobacterium sp. 3HN19-14 TaxID=3448133 RepID=UPI003EE27EA4